MKLAPLAAAVLALAAAACVGLPPQPSAPPPSLLPPPIARPPSEPTYNIVTANADAARVIRGLATRGLRPVPDDVSQVDWLAPAPGYVWRVGPDWLHVHVYRDRAAAALGAQRFVSAVMSRSQIIDWVGTPRLFQCGSAVVLFLGDTPQALNILTDQCGAPAWQRP